MSAGQLSKVARKAVERARASGQRAYITTRGLFGGDVDEHWADAGHRERRRKAVKELVAAGLIRDLDDGTFELLGELRKR